MSQAYPSQVDKSPRNSVIKKFDSKQDQTQDTNSRIDRQMLNDRSSFMNHSSIRNDSSLKKDPPSQHKRNLTVGFGTQQQQTSAANQFNTISEIHNSGVFDEDTKNRPNLRLTDFANAATQQQFGIDRSKRNFLTLDSHESSINHLHGQSFTSQLS